ncbi:MAG: chromate transporter [Clostridia bacterium]|nr:chromate transporter [Clostridia bacterium]
MIYLELFLGFLKVGFFAFGGAYAAIPFIRETVLSYGWLSDDMVSYIIAVSESTPGPIMVNMATYVGASKGGILGSAIATFAVVLPAFVIILLIMVILKALLKNQYFRAILSGLQSAIIGIIAATGFFMTLKNIFAFSGTLKTGINVDIKTLIFTLCLAVIYYYAKRRSKGKISPIYLILFSAAAGVAVYGI